MISVLLSWLLLLCATAAYLYLGALFTWAWLTFLYNERWWWLFLLNSFAVHLFLPLPLVLLIALWVQQPALWVGVGAALLLVLYLYGGLFWPQRAPAITDQPTLSVMTFNTLAYSHDAAAVLTALRVADADVVALQELNLALATALSEEMRVRYPHQVLNPSAGSSGMGVISRYPLQPTDETIPGAWLGAPQVLTLHFGQTPVRLINCHAISINFDEKQPQTLQQANATVPAREAQMQSLADFAAAQHLPVIAVGDFNTAEQTRAYRTVTRVLRDAWREGGFGLGHTFPGADSPASSRPVFWGILVPMWLVRIDYIFHSPHWRTLHTQIGPWDGVSDHRPVLARLAIIVDPQAGRGVRD